MFQKKNTQLRCNYLTKIKTQEYKPIGKPDADWNIANYNNEHFASKSATLKLVRGCYSTGCLVLLR